MMKAIEDRRILNTDNLSESPYSDHAMLAKQGLRAGINCPLIASGKAIGSLNVGSKYVNAYTDKDEQILFHISSHLANNLENQKLIDRNVELVNNMLPAGIAEQLKLNPGQLIAD